MIKIGYIPGVFDLFHNGHICLIEKSLLLCDKLVVGVHTDDFTKIYKRLPQESQELRKQNILNFINKYNLMEKIFAIEFVGNSHLEIVKKYGVTNIFHGNDWELESYKKQIRYLEDGLDLLNVEINILKYTLGISSTLIKQTSSKYNFSKITEVLFDLDNTLILNELPTYKAVECINFLKSKNIEIKVITNNNRYSPNQICETLKKSGIFLEVTNIMSSLKQVLTFLQSNKTIFKKVFIWGSANAKNYLIDNEIYLEQIVEKSDLIVFLYNDNFNYEELSIILTHISKQKIPFIIGNLDLLYPDKIKILPDTGIVYKIIQETLGKQFKPIQIFGKPNPSIYNATANNNFTSIMVGDNILTDGEYAKNLNIPFIHITNEYCDKNEKDISLKIFQISHLGVLIDYINFFS